MAEPITPEMKAQQLQQLRAQYEQIVGPYEKAAANAGQAYFQRDQCQRELDQINQQLAKDPTSEDLLAKKQSAEDCVARRQAQYDNWQPKEDALKEQLDDIKGQIAALEKAPVVTEQTSTTTTTTTTTTTETTTAETAATTAAATTATQNTGGGTPSQVEKTKEQKTAQDIQNSNANGDWRVRLSLAPGATYLYKDETNNVLAPLAYTDGIIFPYTPNINITYGANYPSPNIAHTNYKVFQYESSYVDNITITCDFTAQDTFEANYLLATIIFLKSLTKMFYGQDNGPKPGTPPPLCFLHGLGELQFSNCPLAINNFTYNLPNDVDYIRSTGYVTRPQESASTVAQGGPGPGASKSTGGTASNFFKTGVDRLKQGVVKGLGSQASKLLPGGGISKPEGFKALSAGYSGSGQPTYVPTKINISITAVPIVSRYDISNNFSLQKYGDGTLIKRGMW